MMKALRTWVAALALGLPVVACSGDSGPAGPVATALQKLSGDEQAGAPGATLPQPLEVRVTDGGGAPVPGFTVTFAPSAGTVNPTSMDTDAQGRARTTLTLPNQGANVTVTAVGPGVTAAVFTARSVANTIVIGQTFLPAARRGLAYTRRFTATGSSGATITWAATGTLPPGVTLQPDGNLTGTPTQAGAFPITVRASEGSSGEASVQITLNVCEPPAPMAVGEVRVSDPTARGACGLFLPSGAAGTRYRVGVFRTSSDPAPSNAAQATVSVRGIGVTATAAAEASFVSPSSTGSRALSEVARQIRLLEGRRTRHMHHLEETIALAERLDPRGLLTSRPERAPAAASLPEMLQLDPKTTSGSCTAGTRVTAIRLAEDDRLAVYQDASQNGSITTQVTAAQAQKLLDLYRDHGKAIIDSYFGGVPDTDSNGKIIVFITPAVPEDALGKVESGDLFSTQECASSNEGEYIYLHYQMVRPLTSPGAAFGFFVFSHEVKHISSLYQRIRRAGSGAPVFSPLWMEEGSAEVAAERIARYAWSNMGGPPMSAQVTEVELLNDSVGDVTTENLGIFVMLIGTQAYLSRQPNSVVSLVEPSSDIYASGWLFQRWLGDAYGGAGTGPRADSLLFRRLNDQGTEAGVPGVEAVTGRTWTQLMEEFTAAAMVNGRLQIPRGFTSYDFIRSIEIWCFAVDPVDHPDPQCGDDPPGAPGAFPWPVTTDAEGVSEVRLIGDGDYAGPIGPSGLRVHDLGSNGTGSGAEVSVELAGARVVVVRLR